MLSAGGSSISEALISIDLRWQQTAGYEPIVS